MRTRLAIWTTLLAAPAMWAQQPPEKMVQKIIEIKFADPVTVADAVRIFGVNALAQPTLHVISVSGAASNVASAEEAVKKLDVTPHNIELTVYLISGLGGAKAPAADENVPGDLSSTVKQLHALFPFKSYRVSETFAIRNRDGRDGSNSGILPGTNSKYRFSINRATASAGTPRVVHLDGISLTISTQTATDKEGKPVTRDVGLATNLDVGEGEKVVVGKSNINGTEDALILVLTAKVL
jgi:hypothetical protein